MARFRYQHIKSSVEGKAPTAAQLKVAEIGVNDFAGDEKLFIKNSTGDVVDFPRGYSREYIDDNERVIAEALNDLNSRKMDSSAYTEIWESGTGERSAVLKGSSGTASGDYSVAEGHQTSGTGVASHAEGTRTTANGYCSHAEGGGTIARGYASHAEGGGTTANGNNSHAEGGGTTASGDSSHAEGSGTQASGSCSHAEGGGTIARGYASHAEGGGTQVNGYCSHAEGGGTQANGRYSHAEGYFTIANGNNSHAEGYYTETNNESEHASGQYNVSSEASATFGNSGNTLFSIGNGTSPSARHNAFEIRQNGDIYIVNKDGDDVRLQDEIGNIDVDQVIDETTSASTNPVSSKAVYKAATDNELVWTNAFVALSGAVSAHTENTEIHVTAADKTAWDEKLDDSAISDFFDDAKYEDSGTTKVINFYHGNTIKATIDASDFIVDGMVDDVRIENGNLVVDFNTASGKQDISIPLTSIFDPSNYYNKTAIDNLVGSGFTSSSITEVIIENEEIVSAALTDLDERKLDASAYTPTDLSNYYTKSETSGATEISNALGAKVNSATYTGHTADTTIHFTTGAVQTQIDNSISGKVNTSDIVTAITSSNSGSTNPIATKVVAENELVVSTALNDLNTILEGKIGNTINITWINLKNLRDNSQLVPGQWYRITDYTCTTTQADTQSAGHQFDIIVRADDVNVLNENAYAALHEGDTYFANCNLAAWKLRYTIDNIYWSLIPVEYITFTLYGSQRQADYIGTEVINNTEYYKWHTNSYGDFYTLTKTVGDYTYTNNYGSLTQGPAIEFYVYSEEEGKGTILRMIDEFDNDCPYDFKNIQFKRWNVTDSNGRYGIDSRYMGAQTSGLPSCLTIPNTSNFIWTYTFSSDNGGGVQTDYSLSKGKNVHNNVIKIRTDNTLPNNVFFGNNCYNNTFGNTCYNNTFSYNCHSNTFGNNCYNNTFSNQCDNNTFGDQCYSNIFGNYFHSNIFGDSCYCNIFGNVCSFNTLNGPECKYNTFGNYCAGNKFAKAYCKHNIIENGNWYITLTTTQTTSYSNQLCNIKICQGVNNIGTEKIISHNTVGDTFQTEYKPVGSQIINV